MPRRRLRNVARRRAAAQPGLGMPRLPDRAWRKEGTTAKMRGFLPGKRVRSGIEKTAPQGDRHRMRAIGGAELGGDVLQPCLHRVLGDAQQFGDPPVAVAGGDQAQHGQLLGGEHVGVDVRGHFAGDLAHHHAPAERGAADRLQDVVAGGGFQQIGHRAQHQRLLHARIARIGGEDDDARIGKLAADRGDRLQSVHARHLQIEHGDVRPLLAETLDAFHAIAGFAGDLHVRRAFDRGAQAVAHDRMVVGDQDPERPVVAVHAARPPSPSCGSSRRGRCALSARAMALAMPDRVNDAKVERQATAALARLSPTHACRPRWRPGWCRRTGRHASAGGTTGMKRRGRRAPWLLLWCAALLCPALRGQDAGHWNGEQFRPTAWSVEHGAPADIWALAQDRDGFLWLGTGSGLYRFDGVAFERFEPRQGENLRTNDITALSMQPDGTLWIGLFHGGASALRDGRLTSYSARDGFPTSMVTSFARTADGPLWAASRGGLARFDGTRWEIAGADWNYPAARAEWVMTDRDGTLWVTTGDELLSLRRGGHRFEATGIRVARDTTLSQAPDGRIWLSSGPRGTSALPAAPAAQPSEGLREDPALVHSKRLLFDRRGYL